MSHDDPQHDGLPVLDGFIENHRQGASLRVWCRWCCCWHIHGLADAKPGDYIHRVAHCYAPDSTYDDTGYYIRVTGTPFSAVRNSVRQVSSTQRWAMQDGRVSVAVQRLREQPRPVG
jgi:hypothetical protein